MVLVISMSEPLNQNLKETEGQNMEQKLKERPSRHCPTLGSIPSTDTKPDTIADAKKCLQTGA